MAYFIFEITPKCDFNCIYCYNVWKDKTDYQQSTLTLNKIEELFEKLSTETTIEGVTITGGEPLLYPDLIKVVEFLKNKGINVGLTTHGIHLSEDKIKQLIDAGVSYFEISLDALDENIYHKLTGDSQLDKVKSAILNIKKHKALLTVSTIITKLNLSEISKIIDLTFAFSVDFLSLNRFIPGGVGKKHVNELKPSIPELKEVLFIANEKARKYNFTINISTPIEDCIIPHSDYSNLNFGTCVCGSRKWLIDSIGNLRTCEQNPEIIGNLLNNTFQELYNSEMVNNFRQNNFKKSCTTCDYLTSCGGGCRFVR